MTTYGIDALAVYIPKLYLDIADLAEAREIPYEKTEKRTGSGANGLARHR